MNSLGGLRQVTSSWPQSSTSDIENDNARTVLIFKYIHYYFCYRCVPILDYALATVFFSLQHHHGSLIRHMGNYTPSEITMTRTGALRNTM